MRDQGPHVPAPRRHFAEKHRVFPRSQRHLASNAQTGSSSCSDSLPVKPSSAPFGLAAYRGLGTALSSRNRSVLYSEQSDESHVERANLASSACGGHVASRSRGFCLTRGFRRPVPLAASLRGVLPGLCGAPPLACLPAFHPGTRSDGPRPGRPPRVGAPLREIAAP